MSMCWRFLVAVLSACVSAVVSSSALAASSPGGGALVVISDGGDVTGQLVPGATVVWPVEVTTRIDRLDSLLGRLSVAGGLAHAGNVTAEVVSCLVPWLSDHCASGEHAVLALTPLDQLLPEPAALQAPPKPRPGTTYLEVRIRVASDAHLPEDATMTAILRVDASGPDGDTVSHPTLSVSTLANTGASVCGYGVLAVAAIAAGLLIAGVAALIQRRRGMHA
ncbi:hypothetical protein [Arthrobacter bambusae]|uniref:Gram-positive cocci surface proteins LPxTG domain-containing protein n=1 Tax=Arthrobacter bambusae TaxID=1338426 RepID=A0AAW8DIK1_9MICC|nr:hypothetical protein [Arthrobacter bambusae]MDP9904653.1 hypothetical protein [Arthrobacter bambusae]MDQ0129469.1 hypothetical protein [Arthrobacter bambusae]MDQ0180918.1 hypothetical protein [Arthrobacter bambusae]